ncbi:MAG: hypothetical protein WCB11_28155 [Terriglobales bacterium]|jgi:hypothetical protein
MKMVAMGVRMHSGWGALVVVANEDGRVNVVARRAPAARCSSIAGDQAQALGEPQSWSEMGSRFICSKTPPKGIRLQLYTFSRISSMSFT